MGKLHQFLTKERRVLEEKLMVTKSDVYKFDASRPDVPKREDGKTGYKRSCTHLSFQQHSIIINAATATHLMGDLIIVNKWTRNACSQELHYHLQSTQREGPYYLCPQPSHQQSIKKHFLVCKEHQELDENQKLLEKYIQNFMKSSNLPNFARSLSLTTQLKMTPQQKSHKIGNLQCTNSKGIYLLQRINVENGTFDIL